MRAALFFAAVSLVASGAFAQTPTPAQSTGASSAPATATASAKPDAAKRAPGDTVSGITVSPFPKKACSSRDKECIAMVVAELKQRFPEELKRFCFNEQASAVRTQIVNEQLRESLGGNNPSIPISSEVSPIIKTACAADKK